MEIRKVVFSYGITQNLTNFSNCRPEITVEADLQAGDDYRIVIADLAENVIKVVHDMADEEMELCGMSPKYSDKLFWVLWNRARGCVVVVPLKDKGLVPIESNKGGGDRWTEHFHSLPVPSANPSRYTTAVNLANAVAEKYKIERVHIVLRGDFSNLPPLPDEGCEQDDVMF